MANDYLKKDIAECRRLYDDYMYEHTTEAYRATCAEELIATIPKWLEIAEELNDALDEESEAVGTEDVEEDLLSPQMMILKGTQMIQQGNSLLEAESNAIISYLVTTKQLDPALRSELKSVYSLYKGNPSTAAEFWINDPNRSI
ncbi:hypothetical protein M0R04_14890 [Candidatus Dojkabacteria bacterium]|jgi:hypothetical protein|nr:hypothetical protein [Candidatus Dojkabacteria bacterium]